MYVQIPFPKLREIRILNFNMLHIKKGVIQFYAENLHKILKFSTLRVNAKTLYLVLNFNTLHANFEYIICNFVKINFEFFTYQFKETFFSQVSISKVLSFL